MYQLFEYEQQEVDYMAVYVVAKNVAQALARLQIQFPNATLSQIKQCNGDILTFMYADESRVYNSGVN